MKILRYIVNIILISIMLFVIYVIISNLYLESRLEMREPVAFATRTVNTPHNNMRVTLDRQEMIIHDRELKYMGKLQGYNIIARLEIPRINLITDVLEEYNESALRVSVTKFTGPNPNEIGNFCITGHNYINSNMFSRLNRLRVGDNLFLTDGHGRTIEYEIYDVFKVWPDNGSVLNQYTEGRRKITLITCTSDSRQRIVVQAVEKR